MTSPPVGQLARELFDAERAATALAPLSRRYPELTAGDAYAIQEGYGDLRIGHGARLVGRKIGCTSKAIQELFDIDTPDYGQIFDDMVVPDGGNIPRSSLVAPMVEPEIAFKLGHDLQGPGLTRSDVLAATESVAACLEVIDSRITGWEIVFVDTVADNGSSARCVIGEPRSPEGLDLAAIEGALHRNGAVVATATGEAVLGHPADAVSWLANLLGELGRGLRAGDYVLSGSFTTAVHAHSGDLFEAWFTELGGVTLHID